MVKWAAEEDVIVLYYASREIRHASIIELLKHKHPASVRVEKNVSWRLRSIRGLCQEAGQGQMQERTHSYGGLRPWDLKVVDSWLVQMMEKGKLEKLIELDDATIAIIEGNHNLDQFKAIMALNA